MAIPRAVSPWRTEPDRRSADPTVRKATVVRCHVTWIIVLVIVGPPKRLDGNVPGDSCLTTRTSPATPWMAAPRTARDPAMMSGAFTPQGPIESGGRVTKVGFFRATLALRYERAASAVAGSHATHVSGSRVAVAEPVRTVARGSARAGRCARRSG